MEGQENLLYFVSKKDWKRARLILDALEANDKAKSKPTSALGSNDPVFEEDGKFYFWDETWANNYGPFLARGEASEGCRRYAKHLDDGSDYTVPGCHWRP